jgi:hypothetical protein
LAVQGEKGGREKQGGKQEESAVVPEKEGERDVPHKFRFLFLHRRSFDGAGGAKTVEVDLGGTDGILGAGSLLECLEYRRGNKDIFYSAAAGASEVSVGSGVRIDENFFLVDGKYLHKPCVRKNLGGAVDGGVRNGGEVLFQLLIDHFRRRVIFTSMKEFKNADPLGGYFKAFVP